MLLKEKTAIITGASSGVGREIAFYFAREGAKIVNADISPDDKLGGKATHQEIRDEGGSAEFFKVDVSKEAEVDELVRFTMGKYSKIDILVNNAGVLSATGLFDTDPDKWDRIMEINLKGPFLTSKRCAEEMKKNNSGRIINLASIFGVLGHLASTAYITSKGGLIALTKQMAMELGKFNITVNAVLPGTVKTGFFKEQRLENPDGKVETDVLFETERLERLKKRSPLGEIQEPKDIAEAVLFLATKGARYVTGICLPVDGGVLAGRMD